MTMPFSGSINLKNLAVILLTSASLWLALFATASAEEITSFDVDYEIRSDSSVLVTEIITYDFGYLQKHGIYRNVRNKHPQEASTWYKERYVDINLLSVTRDGMPEPYTLESYDGMSAKIGRANQTITGSHTYKIVYELKGALAEYPEGVELYWNVTGNEWPVTINNIKVTVHTSPENYLASQSACYVGLAGTNGSCSNKEILDKTSVFRQDKVYSGQEMTIAQSLDFLGKPLILESIKSIFLIIPAFLILLIGFFIYGYRLKYKFRRNDSIIAQYEPLKEIEPMITGALMDDKLDPRDISAAIVYMAQQGYISIKQLEEDVFFGFKTKDYEVTLLRPISETKSNFHETILKLLFSYYDVVGKSVKLSNIKKDRQKRITNGNNLILLKEAVKKDLLLSGYFEYNFFSKLLPVFSIILVLLLLTTFISNFNGTFIIITLMMIVLTLFSVIAGKRRTDKGYEVLNYLKGFKEFLSVTEKERYKFHNAPSLSPEKFMEYLPYAIAFGVEKEWAEVFKDISIDVPSWYSSNSGDSFDSGMFTANMTAFSSSLVGATSSPPSTSGSSGGFGSGGGGFSGGGGGGGGGGSW